MGHDDGQPEVCAAPCSSSLPAGTCAFGLTRDNGGEVPVKQPVELRGSTRLEGRYESRAGLRRAGWVVGGTSNSPRSVARSPDAKYTPVVRIAFSGSHRVGKSTLLELVADALPRYKTVDEPYHLCEEEGYECSEAPSIEDFEAQLERSLAALEDGEQNVLFDRCPADIFAYLLAHDDAGAFDAEEWLERTREAMQTLDLVVFVPIEERERIALPAHEDGEFRLAVHEKLQHLLVDDAFGFGTEVLTVQGDVPARVDQVMTRIGREKRRSQRKS